MNNTFVRNGRKLIRAEIKMIHNDTIRFTTHVFMKKDFTIGEVLDKLDAKYPKIAGLFTATLSNSRR